MIQTMRDEASALLFCAKSHQERLNGVMLRNHPAEACSCPSRPRVDSPPPWPPFPISPEPSQTTSRLSRLTLPPGFLQVLTPQSFHVVPPPPPQLSSPRRMPPPSIMSHDLSLPPPVAFSLGQSGLGPSFSPSLLLYRSHRFPPSLFFCPRSLTSHFNDTLSFPLFSRAISARSRVLPHLSPAFPFSLDSILHCPRCHHH